MNSEKAFNIFLASPKGQECLNAIPCHHPYNNNILWWAFIKGYEQAIEDYKNEKLYNATKNLTTASERRKAKLKLNHPN